MYPQQETQLKELLAEFISSEQLPDHYAEDAEHWFLPLIAELRARQQNKAACLLVGINGAQGTGKSTLAALLTRLLQSEGSTVANMSIDDFYLAKQARNRLAAEIHPLLASRGVPGTHDTELLSATMTRLQEAGTGDTIPLPRFDKAIDDCVPSSDWPQLAGPVDFIILEGWCIGLEAQTDSELEQPVNALESQEDGDGIWRRYVNNALNNDYQTVFGQLDYLIMLRAPSFEQVYEWRGLQEQKLRARSTANAAGLMDDRALQRFIQHFERLTRHCLAHLAERADRVYVLDTDHRVVASNAD